MIKPHNWQDILIILLRKIFLKKRYLLFIYLVMNMSQQKALWDFINGGSNGGAGGTNIVINNSAANLVRAQPQITKDKIELLIDARVNDSLKNGRYNTSLNMAQQGMSGDFYGI